MINTKTCPSCFEDIPEGVLAVWHLWNADEINKHGAEIQKWEANRKATDESVEDPFIYKDSSPLPEFDMLDEPPVVYLANGDVYETDEMGEWNGTENVLLFSCDDKPIPFDDKPIPFDDEAKAAYSA